MASFDYVIVGGGSAGATLAGRLLSESDARVALIETGSRDSHPLMPLPAGFAKLMPTRHLFHYQTEPQPELDGRPRILPQGRVLGGGSSVNAMVYIRGQAQDFDDWADMGAQGWSYNDVLPYFKRSETNQRFADEYHGSDGPLGVSDLGHINAMTKGFIRAAQSVGHEYNPDFNGARQKGVGFCQATIRDNRRSSSARAFLHQQLKNPRLKLFTGATALRLEIENNRAVGVVYEQGGKTLSVRAESEVILSAGAIATPKLLMLSGIGPEAELQKHGIKTRLNLPGVGQNLHDHCEVPVIAFCRPGERHGYFGQDKGWRMIRNGLQFLLTGTGPASSNVVEGHCFAATGLDGDRADVQMQFLPLVYLDLMDRPIINQAGATINTCVLRPKSRGQVTLQSANAKDPAKVDPRYLSDPHDVETTIAGLELAREVMASNQMREFVSQEEMPGPSQNTREHLRQHIREYGKTVYHPAGTCRIGTDEMAVVDPQLRVRGIDGLRVADASVMPVVTSGNTNAPSIMIGEKASDLVMGNKFQTANT
ncbi:sorbosone dehydrogenase [Phaeobacter sp. LSS9]|uniref:GMC family oxidoreductase n=1 Tax=Phaeobacter sp. LSS9 TaxID=681157 RepID=UPI000E474980|nr:GMC family oxidoreductase N-terminal domain-containing protein [Phaeobacter sp. LSS9]AXT36257.1 sorbosone dehydrogenase [Phaeobacter sp. LSS9]